MTILSNNIKDQLIKALELDKSGDWDSAHTIVQTIEIQHSYRVHAYLHREEGDLSNAQYWYSRANEKMPAGSLSDEWDMLHNSLSE